MKIKKNNPVTTVLVISMGCLAFYLKTHAHWLLIVSFLVGLAGIFSSFLAKWIDYGWMKLAHVLSLIVPNILLSAVFFLFLYPISLLAKVFSKKDNLKLSPGGNTTFETVARPFDKDDFKKPW